MNYTIFNTPIGFVKIIENDKYITNVIYEGNNAQEVLPHTELLLLAYKQFNSYFDGEIKNFEIPIKLNVSPYHQKVLKTLMSIPYGSTITYKKLAELSGDKNASRAVGNAMRINPIPIIIPCHRVVRSNGDIGNYSFGSISNKDWLITFEQQNK